MGIEMKRNTQRVLTQAAVLGSFLCDHDGLVLLAVELEQTLLVTELLHLWPPHHRLCQITLHLTAVTPRRLVATQEHWHQVKTKPEALHLSLRIKTDCNHTLKYQSWNFLAHASPQKSRVKPPSCRVTLRLQSWLQWLQVTHFKPNRLIKSCLNNSLQPADRGDNTGQCRTHDGYILIAQIHLCLYYLIILLSLSSLLRYLDYVKCQ